MDNIHEIFVSAIGKHTAQDCNCKEKGNKVRRETIKEPYCHPAFCLHLLPFKILDLGGSEHDCLAELKGQRSEFGEAETLRICGVEKEGGMQRKILETCKWIPRKTN